MIADLEEWEFADIYEMYQDIYIIVSPPRCSSTAFARVLWGPSETQYYCHEPFEINYFHDAEVEESLTLIKNPIDFSNFADQNQITGTSLVIKEMTYQVGTNFPILANLTNHPIMFLLRNPLLSIKSRMEKKAEAGADPLFPFVETGWTRLLEQIKYCEDNGIPFMIIDALDFRNNPEKIFPQVFDKIDLDYDPEVLSWQPRPEMGNRFDNLDGTNAYVGSHLYEKVLTSTTMMPDDVPIPSIEYYPEEKNYRQHVRECIEIYNNLRNHPSRILPN